MSLILQMNIKKNLIAVNNKYGDALVNSTYELYLDNELTLPAKIKKVNEFEYLLTISTCGIVPKIREFSNYKQVNLAISLHAPNNEIRDKIMTINKVYKIEDLISVLKKHIAKDVFENSLTFEELEDIIDKGFSSNLEQAVEKVDGNPLAMTYRNGEFLFAWNGNPKNIDELELEYFIPKRADRYHFVGNFIGYVEKLKSARVTKEQYFELIETNPNLKPKLDAVEAEIYEREQRGEMRNIGRYQTVVCAYLLTAVSEYSNTLSVAFFVVTVPVGCEITQ